MDNPWSTDLINAAGVLAGFLLAALLVRILWEGVLRRLVRRTATHLDDLLLPPLRVLVLWGLVFTGIYLSCSSLEALKARPQALIFLDKTAAVAGVILVLGTVLRIFNRTLTWYFAEKLETQKRGQNFSHEAGLVRKAGNVLLSGMGLVYVLRVVGIDISPLLAGGAIGGLAVALALQDTLSNLFAGFFLTIDRPVKVGDFIKLESGDEGFVEEIGWRNTKVRLFANNLVVIPNSKLSQSVITNYFLPEQTMSVYVWCGVSYDSDLQYVEAVAKEVASQMMHRVEGADPEWTPVVRWKEFGDFAITFLTVLRVRKFEAQYELHSEFVKALHERFRREDIEIPFPIRTLIHKSAGSAAEEKAWAGSLPV